MLEVALVYFGMSVLAFSIAVVITSRERRLGRRLFASSVRTKLDLMIARVYEWAVAKITHFMKYIVQLHWYYSLHSVLTAVLRVIVALYTRVESMFEHNRTRAKQLRKEKQQEETIGHLAEVSKHKVETALTPAQKRKLRDKQLEGKY